MLQELEHLKGNKDYWIGVRNNMVNNEKQNFNTNNYKHLLFVICNNEVDKNPVIKWTAQRFESKH